MILFFSIWPAAQADKCHFHKIIHFLDCYREPSNVPTVWLYVCTCLFVLVATVLGIKLFTHLRFGWLHATDELPSNPNAPPFLPPPPPPRAPLPRPQVLIPRAAVLIPLPNPPRPPSVVSYFHLSGDG